MTLSLDSFTYFQKFTRNPYVDGSLRGSSQQAHSLRLHLRYLQCFMIINSFVGPLSTRHPSYLRDTYHFLEVIRPMVVLVEAFLFVIDVDSLYININTEAGLKTIHKIFNRYPDDSRPELLKLLEICLCL
ncbi:hypothetical protein LDENG_00178080 [Lucifuga dentata]|nr:hypothetical protein LDENG_00178080 [Lucifuga dentata]